MTQIPENMCPRCRGKLVDADSEIVCSTCGMVVHEKMVDITNEYDGFEHKNSRTGPPISKLFSDSTIINPINLSLIHI